MVRLLALVAAFLFAHGAVASDRAVLLDDLHVRQDYEQMLQRLFPQVSRGRFPPLTPEESQADGWWLGARAEGGPSALLYFFSWKLMPIDRAESRKWNARARVSFMLEQRNCRRDPPFAWMALFEGRVVANNMVLRDDDTLWYRAVDEALAWYASRERTASTEWLCGVGNALPPETATAERTVFWQKIKAANDARLQAR